GMYMTLSVQLESKSAEIPNYPFPEMTEWDENDLNLRRQLIEDISELLPRLGQPHKHPFFKTQATAVTPNKLKKIKALATKTVYQLQEMLETAVFVSQKLGLTPPKDQKELSHLNDICYSLTQAPNLYAIDIFNSAWLKEGHRLKAALDAGSRLAFLRYEYDEWLIPSAWDADVQPIRQPLMVHGDRGFLKNLSGVYQESRNTLLGLCKKVPPESAADMLKLVDAILEWQIQKEQFDKVEPLLKSLFGIRWMGIENSEWHELKNVGYWLVDFYSEFAKKDAHTKRKSDPLSHRLLTFLSNDFDAEEDNRINQEMAQLLEQTQQYETAVSKFHDLAETPLTTIFKFQQKRLVRILKTVDQLPDMIQYHATIRKCRVRGLGNIVEVLKDPYFAAQANRQYFADWFEWQIAEKLIARAKVEWDVIGGFELDSHLTTVSKFKSLDAQFLENNQLRLAHKHWESLPNFQGHGLMGLLMAEVNKMLFT
ncbi:MAG: hypothetical protein AAF490_25615, partial [Chloroflexota bacterium]